MKLDLAVAYVHHGRGSKTQTQYRNRAQARVAAWSQAHQLVFLTNKLPKVKLSSEDDFRRFRVHWLRRWQVQGGYDAVAFAHQADDLLETRLLRLIRGSGRDGLRAMAPLRLWRWRPLIEVSRASLEIYARERKIKWCEDPSNTSRRALRNWLRHEWLPRLEARQAGATKALSRSLELLAGPIVDFRIGPYVGLRRSTLKSLSQRQQQAVLSRYLKALGLREYGKTHVSEIMKRLANSTTESQFELLGHEFRLTPDLVWASRV
jgi:tRNA(Ile)-lysidine synthase